MVCNFTECGIWIKNVKEKEEWMNEWMIKFDEDAFEN
jgi:hypothetical protein